MTLVATTAEEFPTVGDFNDWETSMRADIDKCLDVRSACVGVLEGGRTVP